MRYRDAAAIAPNAGFPNTPVEKRLPAMPSLSDIANAYGCSKSTARRRVRECFPDLATPADGGPLLDDKQAAAFADFMSKRGGGSPVVPARPDGDAREGGPKDASPADAVELAVLRERVRGLERQVQMLTSEVEAGRAALEREQARAVQPVGFWSRLGQRLLGDGSRE